MNKRYYQSISTNVTIQLMIVCCNAIPASAQPGSSIAGMDLCRQEFVRIVKAYDALNQTAVTITYKYSLSDQPGTIYDSAIAQYRFLGGMISANFDQLELLQNRKVSLTFNREDSFITVSNTPSETNTALLQLRVFDSAFLSLHVDHFEKSITDDDGLNRIKIVFKPQSFYKRYELLYTGTFLIKGLVFELADTDLDEGGNPPPAGRNKVIAISFGNCLHQAFDPSLFDELRYVRKNAEGQWVGAGIYSHCEVVTGD